MFSPELRAEYGDDAGLMTTGQHPFLTISLTTQFLAAGQPGRVTATGTIKGGGRSLLYIDAELVHEDGTVIATSTGVFKRVPQEKLK